ncbi:MAG: hypothetical protein ACP5HU_12295 [Phycisphaerae bacterium]
MSEPVTAYDLCHGHWTVIPHQLEECYKDMADTGFNAVAMSFSESEMRYARRAFEIQVNLARKAGLKVFVVPSRLGGRVAGAPLMPSVWLAQNPQHAVPTGWMPVGCCESSEFRDFCREFMGTIVSDYELDGIIWDEPKSPDLISYHPATVEAFGPQPTREQMFGGYIDWLKDLTDHCRSIRPELTVTLFCQKTDAEDFTTAAAGMEGLDYFGYDGNLQRESFWHESPQWRKYRIDEVWERTCKECEAAGVKRFALVENMLMPAAAVEEFEQNFEAYLQGPLPEHLAVYYYAHNNEDPEAVQSIVRRMMKKYL